MNECLASLYHRTPVGWLRLEADARGLRRVAFAEGPGPDRPGEEAADALLRRAACELDEYFAGRRRDLRFRFLSRARAPIFSAGSGRHCARSPMRIPKAMPSLRPQWAARAARGPWGRPTTITRWPL